MRIAVLVPTFRRPDDLRRCLYALERQVRPADQVIVVVRDNDELSRAVAANARRLEIPLTVVFVDKPGWAQALTKGLEQVNTELVAITDDDAAPREDWLKRMVDQFEQNSDVGGVGGRDVIGGKEAVHWENKIAAIVGEVQWYGEVVGNHHIGIGPSRPVHVLKGVNCAYRVEVLRDVGFDPVLRGHGAQIHLELDVGLAFISRGWKLIYDPAIVVDHFPAPRHDRDQRDKFDAGALSDQVHNQTLALLRYLRPLRRTTFLAWSMSCGTREYPGLVCWLALLAGRAPHASARMLAAQHGRWLGFRSWLRSPATIPALI